VRSVTMSTGRFGSSVERSTKKTCPTVVPFPPREGLLPDKVVEDETEYEPERVLS
jgi:hypothetical protein